MIIESIAIVGAGLIGSSWATFYASKGFRVKMYDIDPEICRKGFHRAKDFIEILKTHGMLSGEVAQKAVSLMTIVKDLDEAVKGVQLVQESVLENYEVKQKIFKAVDAITPPNVILASSSSGLLMTKIQEVTQYPERCLIDHPFNPPHLIPLVELVPGQRTHEDTITKMKFFFEDAGKIPVVLKKEAPGHLANRLAMALWREAVDIVLKGIASVEDVDKALYAGPGLRYALMGPHLIYHLGGGEGGLGYLIDHIGPAAEEWWKSMATWTSMPQEARDILVQGVQDETGDRSYEEISQWRDAKLIRLLKAIYE